MVSVVEVTVVVGGVVVVWNGRQVVPTKMRSEFLISMRERGRKF